MRCSFFFLRVGAATVGAILTTIMCDAMNRDVGAVIFGGADPKPPAAGAAAAAQLPHTETSAVAVAAQLAAAKEVVIVPGYGLAVAKAQARRRPFFFIGRAESV